MQVFLILVVLVFAAPLLLYASPLILYIAPFIAIGLLISWLVDAARSRVRTARH